MQMRIAHDILQDFPQTHVGCVVLSGYTGCSEEQVIHDLMQQAQQLVHTHVSDTDMIKQHPVIQAWHETYQQFGAKPKKHQVSLANLLEKAASGQDMHVHPLVDLYNAISLMYMLPAGAFDLDAVSGDITLRKAGDDEAEVALLGEKEARAPQRGEVIYADGNGAICRRWNWKESHRTRITEDTNRVLFVFEAIDDARARVLSAALQRLEQELAKACSGTTSSFILSQEQQDVQVFDSSSAMISRHVAQQERLEHLPIEDFSYAISYQQSLQHASHEYQARVT